MEKKSMFICLFFLLGLLILGQTTKNDTKDISAYVIKVINDVGHPCTPYNDLAEGRSFKYAEIRI